MRKVAFFDRDGGLNELVKRDGGLYSPQSIDQFKIYDNTREIIDRLKKKGFLSIVISNQPDIARGKLEMKELGQEQDYQSNVLPAYLLLPSVE